ncbi:MULTISPECIES: Ger(x)C family spore germination protein [unclassified Paenibacillus]|uniref:Ger(x)C family spore germination protein n=1 Tax=unclassified Paenibacillus TaxID=185978 RepID=UPI002786457F|nr:MULTISPECIES: Ger(x)C family spore germination protein [unclassified Paenibacillus]MDQ0896503.1 Ger(x)C family germination protein [Paenibacillus sp. V4I7]MDQ0917389.1 Ger(x)C family germination protein [Paenibacillus sp. V4I5]
MKKFNTISFILAALMFVTGCGKAEYIEDQQFVLTEGIDFDENNKFIVYTSGPVFNKVARDKYKITFSRAKTMRESKGEINSKTSGNLAYGKSQNILIGKKLLQQRNSFPYLDVLFRDSRNEINANVIVIDGSVKDVMYTNMSDKGRIASVIKQLAESTYKTRVTVQTTLQEFHQQMKDKGMTPALTEMRPEKNELFISGIALLHKDGTYAASLNHQESSLLVLLQGDTENKIPLMFHFPPEMFHTDEDMSFLSINIRKANRKIKSKFEDDHLTINIEMNVQIELRELMFTLDLEEQKKQLEKAVENELKKECEALIKKAQKNQVDPFQFGVHVRAHNYKDWKKVQDNWGKALSEATVNVSSKVLIQSIGVSE